jgi:glutamyl-tRNA reductase
VKKSISLKELQIVAFTHKSLPLDLLGKLYIAPEARKAQMEHLMEAIQASEAMYIATCNRVEFIFTGPSTNATQLLDALQAPLTAEEYALAAHQAEHHHGEDAVKHLFKVSASLDSMVIGEREIITQVRTAYESAAEMGLTGETIRLLVRKTIETAKEVFTETSIFRKPVSVVSLAFHRLREMDATLQSRILMVGAGKTNKAMARFLTKHGYKNIVIFNRTAEKAEQLANETGCRWLPLQALSHYREGFDILITCTGAGHALVDAPLWDALVNGENSRKIVIDLALPGDVDKEALVNSPFAVRHIDIEELKTTAELNLAERSRDVARCEEIIDKHLLAFHDLFKARQIELAMRDIPEKVKEIRERALNAVFVDELQSLSPEARQTLDRIMAYMEKKYISVPMKMAREVMLNGQK